MILHIQEKIDRVLERIRPTLKSNGGSVHLLDVDERLGVVKLQFRGRIVHTPRAMHALANGVEEAIKKEVPQVREVLSKVA